MSGSDCCGGGCTVDVNATYEITAGGEDTDTTFALSGATVVDGVATVTLTGSDGTVTTADIDVCAIAEGCGLGGDDNDTTYELVSSGEDGTITLVGSDGSSGSVDVCALVAACDLDTDTTYTLTGAPGAGGAFDVTVTGSDGTVQTVSVPDCCPQFQDADGNPVAPAGTDPDGNPVYELPAASTSVMSVPAATDNGDGTTTWNWTHDDGNGTVVNMSVDTCTDCGETTTTFVDNGDGTFTYTSEDGTETTLGPFGGTDTFVTFADNGDDTATLTSADGASTIDVCLAPCDDTTYDLTGPVENGTNYDITLAGSDGTTDVVSLPIPQVNDGGPGVAANYGGELLLHEGNVGVWTGLHPDCDPAVDADPVGKLPDGKLGVLLRGGICELALEAPSLQDTSPTSATAGTLVPNGALQTFNSVTGTWTNECCYPVVPTFVVDAGLSATTYGDPIVYGQWFVEALAFVGAGVIGQRKGETRLLATGAGPVAAAGGIGPADNQLTVFCSDNDYKTFCHPVVQPGEPVPLEIRYRYLQRAANGITEGTTVEPDGSVVLPGQNSGDIIETASWALTRLWVSTVPAKPEV